MKSNDLICDNLQVDSNYELVFAGANTISLAKKYGTPLYLIDENKVRENCRTYYNAVKKAFGDKGGVLYASKALSFKKLYSIINEENLGIDVVSQGEIYTAKMAGFPLEKAFFHSNNKTDEDIIFALENGVGYFVVDNKEELWSINTICGERGIKTNVLLRLTPGIDPHTYDAISTGKVDSKFGLPIETGQALEVTELAIYLRNINFVGFHCHVGSQVFDSSVYVKATEVMLNFIKEVKDKFGYEASILDIGGGYGVKYIASEPKINIEDNIMQVASFIDEKCLSLGIEKPTILFEPGRSIVADSGLTLYTVGAVKKIKGYKNYVSVDGGMTDNPRFALYKANYTVLPAYDMYNERDMVCSVVGRCCESGDIIQENVKLSSYIRRGDIIAVLTTGAYNYSMSSNYNKVAKPPIVMLKDGSDYLAVKRQTLQDMIDNEI